VQNERLKMYAGKQDLNHDQSCILSVYLYQKQGCEKGRGGRRLRIAGGEQAESFAARLLWPCGRTRTLPLRLSVGLGSDVDTQTQD
jgi:hypothetical protein